MSESPQPAMLTQWRRLFCFTVVVPNGGPGRPMPGGLWGVGGWRNRDALCPFSSWFGVTAACTRRDAQNPPRAQHGSG